MVSKEVPVQRLLLHGCLYLCFQVLVVIRLLFKSAVPAANQLKEDDILYLGINALALAGGTIKDAGTSQQIVLSLTLRLMVVIMVHQTEVEIWLPITPRFNLADGPRVAVA